jgi:hypothetical protein
MEERMSPKAELVRQISETAFKDVIDIMACLAVLREGASLVVPRALEAANASRAATIVRNALLQQVVMTVERAFAPANYPDDRHARVAFKHLSDPNIFDEVAKAGSRNIFSRRAILGAITIQTADASDSSTIVIKSWRTRASEIRRNRRPSFLT